MAGAVRDVRRQRAAGAAPARPRRPRPGGAAGRPPQSRGAAATSTSASSPATTARRACATSWLRAAARWRARATSRAAALARARSGRGRCAPSPRRARRIVERGDEHLHAHFAAGAALDAMRLAALTGRPFSVTAHAYDIFLTPRNLRREARARRTRSSAAATTTSSTCAARCRGANVHKIVMGVDVAGVPAPHAAAAGPHGAGDRPARGEEGLRRADRRGRAAARRDGCGSSATGRCAPSSRRRRGAAGGASSCSAAARRTGCALRSRPRTCWRCRASWRATATATRCRSSSRRRWRWGFSSWPPTRSGCPSACSRRGASSRRRGTPQALAEQLRAALALDPRERRAAGAQARAWVRANTDVDAETARMADVIEARRAVGLGRCAAEAAARRRRRRARAAAG